jgi:glycine/D-amino acid oxidase-like deaminating enzyme
MSRCIVVGAGVIGVSTAFRLAQAGVDVTLLDANGPGTGTSATTFAWVGASPLGLASYFDLNVAGMASYRRLRAELGATSWYQSGGSLVWYSDRAAEAVLVERVAELKSHGYPATLLTQKQASQLEPDVRFASSVERIAFHPDEGYAFPRPLIADLLHLGRELGVASRWGDRVVGFDERSTGVSVRLESGEQFDADTLVLCCGRWTGEVVAQAGFEIPMLQPTETGSLAIGLLVLTAPGVHRVGRMLLADDLMIRPDGGGRLLLHSDAHDRRVDLTAPEDHAALAEDVLSAASAQLDLESALEIENTFVGIRALTADLLPAIGRLPGLPSVYAAVTHSGITLGPLLGELIAAEIVTGTDEPLLSSFRPSRFAGAGNGPTAAALSLNPHSEEPT